MNLPMSSVIRQLNNPRALAMSTTDSRFRARIANVRPVLWTLAAAVLISASPMARADQDCKWYAQTTAKQMQLNQTKNCNLKGDGWTLDMPKAVAWCQSVPPEEWRKAIADRQTLLQTCGS